MINCGLSLFNGIVYSGLMGFDQVSGKHGNGREAERQRGRLVVVLVLRGVMCG